ncbi:MAG: hypothetical protein GYA24_19295, partial [Candidatus Lokiarchaeota archaeon]|nr:hypothetical protein [Candidatus Lokiarchaeota archaeon]
AYSCVIQVVRVPGACGHGVAREQAWIPEANKIMPGFFDKLKGGVVDVYSKLANQNAELNKVILENKEFLDTTLKLVKESTDAINALKSFSANETPAIKDAYVAVSEVLGTIEKSRTELVTKMQAQFLGPLNKLADEWKKVGNASKEDENSAKNLEKAKQDLEKSKKKPADKLKPGELEQGEQRVKAAQDKAAKDHEDLLKATAEFAQLKVSTLKEVLLSLVILEGEFYQIASSMLAGTKDKIASINVQHELDVQASAPASK